MNYKHAILKQVSKNKLVVLLNYEKRPIKEECFDNGFSIEFNEKHFKQITMPEWESHFTEVEVHPDFAEEFRILYFSDDFTFTEDLIKGADFSRFVDRIEIEIGCKRPQWNCTKNCGNCPEYAILTYKE